MFVYSSNANINSFFKTLVDHEVTIELKNDIQIRGTLKSVDQYLNIKLDDIHVVEELKYPHLVSNALLSTSLALSATNKHSVIGQERLHPRECRPLRPPPGSIGGYSTT